MILIVEGMDRCGKSTFINNLRKRILTKPKTLIYHASSPPSVPDPHAWEVNHYDSLFALATDMSENLNYDVLFDRFHLGAIVYGKKYRNTKPDDIYMLDDQYARLNPNMILLLLTDYSHRIMDRDDGDSLESSFEEYENTRAEFIRAYCNSSITNKMHINITDNGGFENTLPVFLEFMKGLNQDGRLT